MKTSATYRRIASLYIRAADDLDEIDRLRDDLDPDHWRARGAHVDAMIDELDRDAHEPMEPTTAEVDAEVWRIHEPRQDKPVADAVAVFEEAIGKLGWDPDPLPNSRVRALVFNIQDSDTLELVEALEKRRAHMRPAKKVRDGVLDAIAAQRALLQPVGAKS